MRVFFRVFASQSPDTDYDPNGTYASQPDAANEPGTPLPGAGRDDACPSSPPATPESQTDYQPGGPNIHTLTIPSGPGRSVVVLRLLPQLLRPEQPGRRPAGAGAGCPARTTASSRRSPMTTRRSPAGVSPMSWDQLAQRNLQFTVVDNPGPAATHRAPQTFDIRPSKAIGKPGRRGPAAGRADDRLGRRTRRDRRPRSTGRRWRPRTSSRWPRTWGGAAGLSSSDAHTLTLKVEGGVSYRADPDGRGTELRRPVHRRAAAGHQDRPGVRGAGAPDRDPARQARRRRLPPIAAERTARASSRKSGKPAAAAACGGR